jgi:hypothetical protein
MLVEIAVGESIVWRFLDERVLAGTRVASAARSAGPVRGGESTNHSKVPPVGSAGRWIRVLPS